MKAVLISIQPKWCELIASGKKTVEVRKTKPKLETPFKCYIYCTKGKFEPSEYLRNNTHYDDSTIKVCEGQGKVIGEFVCDAIFPISCYYSDIKARGIHSEQPYTCLTDKEMIDYLGNGVEGYGWHISDLVIYDNPNMLSEFAKPDKCPYNNKGECTYAYHCYRAGQTKRCGDYMERPPQSWCYVEEGD